VAHDVFISYASKDKTTADAACAFMERRNIRCWVAPRDIEPGQPYGEAIIDAIHNCRLMVLILSSSSNLSPHVPKEVERAVSAGKTIVPLRIENVTPAKSLDFFISSVHWLDAITPPLESHLTNLAETIHKILPDRPGAAAESAVPPAPRAAAIAATPVASIASTSNPARRSGMRSEWLVAAVAVLACAVIVAWALLREKPQDHASQDRPSQDHANQPVVQPPSGGVVPSPTPAPSRPSRAGAHDVPHDVPAAPSAAAEALRTRALYYRDQQQDYATAIQYFDQALRAQPNFAGALRDRGDAYLWSGNFSRALDDYDQLIRVDPQAPQAFHRRGIIRLMVGQFQPAQDDLRLAIRADQSSSDRAAQGDFFYDPIWLYLAEAKSGQNGQAELKANVSNLNLDLNSWPGPAAKLFLGGATPRDVLAAASASGNGVARCQGYLFAGEYALLSGQRGDAAQYFRQAVAINQKRQFAWLLAGAELSRTGR
jgi:lipoprotein NlpI